MEQVKPDIVKGTIFGITAFFSLAVFGVLTKAALFDTSPIWVSFLAYITGASCLIPYTLYKGIDYLKSDRITILLGRAILGTLASLCYTLAIQFIPIVNGTLLFNAAPLFLPFLAILFLKEKIAKSIWLAVFIGFVGITIIIKPTEAIFTQIGNLIGVASGMFLAIAFFLMKILTKTEPSERIIFYYLGIGTLIQIPLLMFVQVPHPSISIIYAMLSGITLLCTQLCLARAYKYATAHQVGVYQYTAVAFVGIIEWIVWDHVPPLRDLIGILLVVFAGIIIIRYGKATN